MVLQIVKTKIMEFGQKITINHKLKRIVKYNGAQNDDKIWVKEAIEETEAIVIGIRTLSEGYRAYEEDMGFLYYPQKYIKALLVATDIRRNPFYVTFENEGYDL